MANVYVHAWLILMLLRSPNAYYFAATAILPWAPRLNLPSEVHNHFRTRRFCMVTLISTVKGEIDQLLPNATSGTCIWCFGW